MLWVSVLTLKSRAHEIRPRCGRMPFAFMRCLVGCIGIELNSWIISGLSWKNSFSIPTNHSWSRLWYYFLLVLAGHIEGVYYHRVTGSLWLGGIWLITGSLTGQLQHLMLSIHNCYQAYPRHLYTNTSEVGLLCTHSTLNWSSLVTIQ